MSNSRGTMAAVVLLGALGAAPTAAALDRWTRPFPGVRHLHRFSGLFEYHVVMVDLRNPRVHFVTTDESMAIPLPTDPSPLYRLTTVSQFAHATHASIAVNGNYYDIRARRHSACGLTVSNGNVWHSTYEDRRLDCFESVGFGPGGRAEVFDSRGRLEGPLPEAWMRWVVTGSPRLLRDGEVVNATHPHHATSRNPRTAIGIDRDHTTLYVMVANGREGKNQGMTCAEAARALQRLGAWDAVNLDGGGSSNLYIRGDGGMVAKNGERWERPVSNHFGIVFRDPDAADQWTEPPAPVADERPVTPPAPDAPVAPAGSATPALRVVPASASVAPVRLTPRAGAAVGLAALAAAVVGVVRRIRR